MLRWGLGERVILELTFVHWRQLEMLKSNHIVQLYGQIFEWCHDRNIFAYFYSVYINGHTLASQECVELNC